MNSNPPGDEQVLRQVERALEQGQPVDDPVIHYLARMQPKADPSFQEGLEQMLLNELAAQNWSHRSINRSWLGSAWWSGQSRRLVASAAILLALMALVFGLMSQRPASTRQAAVTPIEASSLVVVAAQEIPAGTTITEEMLAVVSLSELDRQRLRQEAPAREFISDPQSLIGQTAATAIGWFEPITTGQLGEPVAPCHTASCLPRGLYEIGVPLPSDGGHGLVPGNRVDVLAFVDDQVREIASNVLLMELNDTWAMLAAPAWQQGVLMPWSSAGRSVALRLHIGPDAPPRDTSPVEYTFIAPEALPEDYRFDLVVSLPASQGYQLMDLPASLDDVPFTMNGDTLELWFTNLDVISIVRGTAVTIRLAKSDAENLDVLIDGGARLTFLPDTDQSSGP